MVSAISAHSTSFGSYISYEMESSETYTNLPTAEASMENSVSVSGPNLVYISNEIDMKTVISKHLERNTITPMLFLSNTDKGTMEANVLLDNVNPTYFKVDLEAIAHANLIAQTQEMLAQQLSQDSMEVKKNTWRKKNKVYHCKAKGCGKVFSSSNYLNLHTASHTASKSLTCDYDGCGRQFLWPAHLSYHKLTHTNNRQHFCSFEGCGKKFLTSQRLRTHSLIHTGERPYKCTESGCNKSFTTAGNLRNHIRIHTGERPFACDFDGCTKRFTECSSLKKHKLVHSGKKPYKCDVCGKSFSQTGTRTVHMKSHHAPPQSNLVKIVEIKTIPSASESDSPEVLVLQQSTDEVAQFPGLTEHVVTITTHHPESTEQNQNDVPHHVLGAEEVLSGGDINTQHLHSDKTPSVVVLTQPQEVVSLSASYPVTEAIHEEVVYDNDLLHSHLDHEEIHVSNTSMCLEQSGELTVGESIITSQSVNVMTSQDTLSGSTETGKEMAMDPMMECDEEADTTIESRNWRGVI